MPPASLLLRVLLLAALATGVAADVLYLKGGREIEGKITEESAEEVVIETRFGVLRFPRSEVLRIERGKTRGEEFEERWEAAETAADFWALSEWALAERMRAEAKKAAQQVVELEPDHAAARAFLGFVRHGERWVTPEEKAELERLEEEARKRAEGLVPHEGGWVSVEAKAKLDQGLVLHEGRWMSFEDSMEARGFLRLEGEWLAAERVRSVRDAEAAAARAGAPWPLRHSEHALVCGPVEPALMERILEGVAVGWRYFHALFELPEGYGLVGDRVPQFYVFARDPLPYVESVEHFAACTTTDPPGWAEAVKRLHGYAWWDPYCLSSARMWNRPEDDLAGHCFHHFGLMAINRVGYDGRLLPPWYDNGFACRMEYHVHGRNAVFPVANASWTGGGGGTASARKAEHQFDSRDFRRGDWRAKLRRALSSGAIEDFDRLARKELPQLELLDFAVAMAIFEWLEACGAGALPRFHAVLREHAPAAPLRVLQEVRARQAMYDTAFEAAAGMDWRAADAAWRAWFLEQR